MFAQGSFLILTKKLRSLGSSLLTNTFLFTSCLRNDDGYESSKDDTENVDDDFDDNGDNDNSDDGEDGGGENGSDDSCMGIGEGNEITTCITEELELPQEIQEISLAEEVLDGSSDDLSVNDDSHIGDGDKDGDEDVGDGGNEHENDSNMGIAKGEETKTCITEERELPQEIRELSLAETVESLAEPASHEMKMHA